MPDHTHEPFLYGYESRDDKSFQIWRCRASLDVTEIMDVDGKHVPGRTLYAGSSEHPVAPEGCGWEQRVEHKEADGSTAAPEFKGKMT